MSATSSIEWTEKTWNPVRGCSIVSPGCINCYAMKQAHRFSGSGKPYDGLTTLTPRSGPQWTGVVRTVESALLEPLSWKKPQRVFVNSMSDLFHEDVPFEFIDRVFAVMALAPRHTFQILTKRADRMRQYFATVATRHLWASAGKEFPGGKADGWQAKCDDAICNGPFPLPNVWLGVSVEDQQRADERIPLLLQTPAAVRFLSCEPLLGPLDLFCQYRDGARANVLKLADISDGAPSGMQAIHWVIVGGESGPGARPFDISWARSIVKQCKDARVSCFVKQLGANPEIAQGCGDCDPCLAGQRCYQSYNVLMGLRSRKGGDMAEWPSDLRVREFPA
jgi:protein gp37